MKLEIPKVSMVVLVGASGSGKSSFARKHFLPTEIVSSDVCRGLVDDDENSQSATTDAFDLLNYTLEKRLKRGRLTVVDATNVQGPSRKSLIETARKYHVLPVAVVFAVGEKLCHERNLTRPDRQFGQHVVRHQYRDMRSSLKWLRKEGFGKVWVFDSPDDVDSVEIVRTPLFNDKTDVTGPFDIIGDVHGCYLELTKLLAKLGYEVDAEGHRATPPDGRTAIFLGDYVDRGPDSPSVLKLVMDMADRGRALCVPGNHDVKLVRHLGGRQVQLTHGLDLTVEQLSHETPEFREEAKRFLDGFVSHYVLDGGQLVVAHAGMTEGMQGRASGAVRNFALYGETTGEIDEFGLPVRMKWAQDYRGKAMVVYGHTPVPEVEFLNNTVCLDTGCVFGGRLSALRYPEREVVSVAALREYCAPARPFHSAPSGMSAQLMGDDTLDIGPLRQRMHISPHSGGTVIIPEENAVAALEIMSRFAANPKWLVYLPPTMSPCATSVLDEFLEHPDEAFGYFRDNEVETVVCEEKHMGSRSVVVVCKDEGVAKTRFGVEGEGRGVIVTRTGRPFFESKEFEQAFLERVSAAATATGLYDELKSDWLVLDCELLPWSAKAKELLRTQYAPLGAAANAALTAATSIMSDVVRHLPEDVLAPDLLERFKSRHVAVQKYISAYRRYCWHAETLTDYKLAPFHIMASENAVHVDKDHTWHMERLGKLALSDPEVMRSTPYKIVEVNDEQACRDAAEWWLDLTSRGGEGMVVKPLGFTVRGPHGFVQPALKVRGREYLRIIYGPEYLEPENLSRLKKRGLNQKRRLANREYVLGVEALSRFVERMPLRAIHECVFGVLALESEPVDPRL